MKTMASWHTSNTTFPNGSLKLATITFKLLRLLRINKGHFITILEEKRLVLLEVMIGFFRAFIHEG